MTKALSVSEAVSRMNRRKSKSIKWSLRDMTVEWSYIPATSARNWDGSFAGERNDANQEILQLVVTREGQLPRFTNYW